MNNRTLSFGKPLAGLLAIVVAGFCGCSSPSDKDFDLLFSADGGQLSELRFYNYNKSSRIVITNKLALSYLVANFCIETNVPPQLGHTYEADFAFPDGNVFKTYVYVHSDGEGITVANPLVTHAGDPELHFVRFAPPINPEIAAIFQRLSRGFQSVSPEEREALGSRLVK